MLRLFFALLCLFSAPLMSQCEDAGPDLQPLLDLYRNTNGSGWINGTGWQLGDLGLDCDYCNWTGVTCNADQRVTRLLLDDNGLSGTLHENFSDLSELTVLNLQRANIGSSISEIEGLSGLETLNLYQVNYAGPFPAFLLGLNSLRELNLAYNAITGQVPDFSGQSQIRRLYLDVNNFTGPPPPLTNMNNLREISLQHNEFSGRIPESWTSENLPRLESLDARFCQLSGPVPVWLASLAGATIDLGSNELNGCYPAGLGPFCGNNPPRLIGNSGLPSNGADWFFNNQFCQQGEECPPCPEELVITHDSILYNYRALYPSCTDLAGDLIIRGDGISDLHGLETITTVGGDLIVEDTDITDLEGLDAVSYVAGDWIVRNASLASIRPLRSIGEVGGSLTLKDLPNLTGNGFSAQFSLLSEVGASFIADNLPQLTSLQSFGNLSVVPGSLQLMDLDAMTTFDGPGYLNIREVTTIQIYDNDLLEHVDYFRDLAFVHIGNLLIVNNPELRNLNGFDEAGRIDRIAISHNAKLTICAVPPVCRGYDPATPATLFFQNNGYGCESAAQVGLDCEGNLPLPVDMLSFNAYASGKVNELEWEVLNETGLDYYGVEYSTDEGLSWSELTKVEGTAAGAGEVIEQQGSGGLRYSATDEAPFHNTLYRLRVMDLDDSFAFSPIVAVQRTEIIDLQVAPNPSQGDFVVTLPTDKPATLRLHDAAGREVWRRVTNGAQTIRALTGELPPGVYLLRVSVDDELLTKWVVLL
jgi:hypothetical protein